MFYGVKLGETGQLKESEKGGYSVTSHSWMLGQTTVYTSGGKTMKCTTTTWSAQHHSGGSV